MVLRDKIIMDIKDMYKAKNVNHESICVVQTNFTYQSFQKIKKEKCDENFYIKSIINIPHKSIPIRLISLDNKRCSNKIKEYEGIYEIKLSNNTMIYYFNIINRNSDKQYNFLIGEFNNIKKIIRLSHMIWKKEDIINNGVYEMWRNQFNFNVYKKHSTKSSPIVHSQYNNILNDINFYFDNLSLFKRFNSKGIRKILLVGEPGTGKSSIINNISVIYKNEKNISFTTNIDTFPEHIKKCNNSSLPSIIVLEDADSSLCNSSSDLLNFLDGFNQPTTKYGCYVIMSTNNPNLIDDRIKKRPGRIDKIFDISNLKGNDAIECAKIYFKNIVNKKFFLNLHKNIFDNMTGSQIKELSQSTSSYAAANNINDIDFPLILKIKTDMFDSLTKIDDYCEMKSIKASVNKKSMGFSIMNENEVEEF